MRQTRYKRTFKSTAWHSAVKVMQRGNGLAEVDEWFLMMLAPPPPPFISFSIAWENFELVIS